MNLGQVKSIDVYSFAQLNDSQISLQQLPHMKRQNTSFVIHFQDISTFWSEITTVKV